MYLNIIITRYNINNYVLSLNLNLRPHSKQIKRISLRCATHNRMVLKVDK